MQHHEPPFTIGIEEEYLLIDPVTGIWPPTRRTPSSNRPASGWEAG